MTTADKTNQNTAPKRTLRCGICGLEKPRDEFHSNAGNLRGKGVTYRCRDCKRQQETMRRYRLTFAAHGAKELRRLKDETSERLTMLQSVIAGDRELPPALVSKVSGKIPRAKKGEAQVTCSLCKLVKPVSAFHVNRANPRGKGVAPRCKPCQRLYQMRQRYTKVLNEKGLPELRRMEADMVERIEMLGEVLRESPAPKALIKKAGESGGLVKD
jgi:hypothetical protein